MTVGAHLHVQRLRNPVRRLSYLLIAASTITPLIVFGCVYGIGDAAFELAVFFGAVSIAAAPATIVALVRETPSKGVFVKTLTAAVALNNTACIVVFEVCRATLGSRIELNPAALLEPNSAITQLVGPVLLGAVAAIALDRVTRLALGADRLATAAGVALALTSGLATSMGMSAMLACLVRGALQIIITHSRSHLVDSVFANFQPAILTVFFTLAGMHLSFEHLERAGILVALFFSARVVGKMTAANLALRAAAATQRIHQNLGLALIPQAGVAVGLVLLIQDDPRFADMAGLFAAVVLSAVTLNEIVGPVLTRFALRRAEEIGRDRLRLIDFLQEEHIVRVSAHPRRRSPSHVWSTCCSALTDCAASIAKRCSPRCSNARARVRHVSVEHSRCRKASFRRARPWSE